MSLGDLLFDSATGQLKFQVANDQLRYKSNPADPFPASILLTTGRAGYFGACTDCPTPSISVPFFGWVGVPGVWPIYKKGPCCAATNWIVVRPDSVELRWNVQWQVSGGYWAWYAKTYTGSASAANLVGVYPDFIDGLAGDVFDPVEIAAE